MTFKKWFEDMQERYQAYYGGYEELLQEAFEAGVKQEREACANICEIEAWRLKKVAIDTGSSATNMRAIQASNDVDAIRARGEA